MQPRACTRCLAGRSASHASDTAKAATDTHPPSHKGQSTQQAETISNSSFFSASVAWHYFGRRCWASRLRQCGHRGCGGGENDGDRLTDLHVWRLGPGYLGAILSVATTRGRRDPMFYRERLAGFRSLSHVTIKVRHTSTKLQTIA